MDGRKVKAKREGVITARPVKEVQHSKKRYGWEWWFSHQPENK